jgi:undecaprenyl-phosphate 4-deoxy-4-formamido-L-arabinose transferase
MKLSIVIPAYNEEDTIKEVVLDAYKQFPKAEIIVVNDASTDKTLNILKGLDIPNLKILVTLFNRGHAFCMIQGLKKAAGDYVLYMDADNQIHLSEFALEPLDYDVLSGYRVDRQDKFFRKVISFLLKMTILLRHRMWINDANCPFKVFEKDKLLLLLGLIREDSIVPSISMMILAYKYKMNVVEVPVNHYPYIKERKGTLQSLNRKSIKFFWKAFKEVWNP